LSASADGAAGVLGRIELVRYAAGDGPRRKATVPKTRPSVGRDTLARVQKIVVAYDDPASVTLERAVDLARSVGAELIVTNVSATVEAEDPAVAARRAQTKLGEARQRLAGRELSVDFVPIVGPPGQAIVRLADERGADLIVVGTRKKGFFERLVEGSVNQEVLRRASCDVLVVHK
jgi:nucleotide-binding universal stress UspA family protein